MSSDDDPPESSTSSQITAVVLAAGRGQRLGADVPKPLFPICGRAMASHVLHALGEAGIRDAVVVIPPGARGADIQQALETDSGCVDLRFATQQQPRGTADALMAARPAVRAPQVFVVNGDLPLLSADLVRPLLHHDPADDQADAMVATTVVDDPARMGRILRDDDGGLQGIVEWRDASASQRAIREVNLGIYRFRAEFLWPSLERLIDRAARSDEAGEVYATDVIGDAVTGGSALAIAVGSLDRRLNVETPSDAADAEAIMRRRIVDRLLDGGVRIRDREAVWIDAGVEIAAGAMIEPGCHIRGRSTIAAGSRVGPNAIIENAAIGPGCVLESCTVRDSVLHERVEVGPYSTVRPGCEIESHAHIGTHAELKESRIGPRVQVGHFSYLGDADVGARTNIGAGAITCNFDGEAKHRTSIGADAFIGCDTMLIAPVRIGERARTGAGAVVNKDVPADANAVGHPARLAPSRRSRQESESEA